MRLLLLLSALLTALSGVASPRALAHPVEASAAASVAASPHVATATKPQRFIAPPYTARPPLRLATPAPVVPASAPALYAERRRE